MKIATLCFLVKYESKEVLLGFKKHGFGSGKYNGFGGKLKEGETIEEAALRELEEECGIEALETKNLGELTFFFKHKPEWNQVVHVFVSEQWAGEPVESNEMAPSWFSFDKLPLEKMWQDDKHWLPLVLAGKKVKAEFTFGEDNETIIDMKLGEM